MTYDTRDILMSCRLSLQPDNNKEQKSHDDSYCVLKIRKLVSHQECA